MWMSGLNARKRYLKGEIIAGREEQGRDTIMVMVMVMGEKEEILPGFSCRSSLPDIVIERKEGRNHNTHHHPKTEILYPLSSIHRLQLQEFL